MCQLWKTLTHTISQNSFDVYVGNVYFYAVHYTCKIVPNEISDCWH